MATANFEIGNKEFEVRFIPESGYPPTKNERGSSLMSLMALWLGWTKELQKSKQWKANGQR